MMSITRGIIKNILLSIRVLQLEDIVLLYSLKSLVSVVFLMHHFNAVVHGVVHFRSVDAGAILKSKRPLVEEC